MTPTEEIRQWQKKFRVLKGWKIRYEWRAKTYEQVCIHPKKRRAIVYAYGGKDIPVDYFFHEVLHIALRDVMRTRNRKARRDKEETLVQDMCKLICRMTERIP